jgi:DNA-binding transcriptional regulator/RsmH inhibitor MraZ
MGNESPQIADFDLKRPIQILGYDEDLKLDDRGRFRLPGQLARILRKALEAAPLVDAPVTPTDDDERLGLYFAPGLDRRIFIYPVPNIHLAVDGFNRPAPGADPQQVRAARDYFYYRLRFVQGDRQNRFQLPDGLRAHAEIDASVDQITIIARERWLTLMPTSRTAELARTGFAAFDAVAADMLDPINPYE